MVGVVARGERGAYDGIRPEYDRYGALPLLREANRRDCVAQRPHPLLYGPF